MAVGGSAYKLIYVIRVLTAIDLRIRISAAADMPCSRSWVNQDKNGPTNDEIYSYLTYWGWDILSRASMC